MAYKAKNCPKCGNVYIEIGHKVCPDCYKDIQAKELEVCAYIRDNPDATVEKIIKDIGVDVALIRRMAREGYFEEKPMSYPCKKCGSPIFKGSLCVKCMSKIQKNIKTSINAIDARKKLMSLDKSKGSYKSVNKDK